MASELAQRNGLYGFDYVDDDKRRAPEGERKTYEIKQFWQRHHEIISLSARGFSNVEISTILGCHPQTVSNTLNSQLGQEKLSQLREIRDGDTKIRLEQIRVLTDKAVAKFNEILDNENGKFSPKDEKETADKILLELSGLRAPTKIQTATVIMTPEDIADMKKRGLEEARRSGLVVDIPAEEA